MDHTLTLKGPKHQEVLYELNLMKNLLKFDDTIVLELGCGSASRTRQIALQTQVKNIIAAEVDPHAHKKNLREKSKKVSFAQFGAQNIAAHENYFDIVIMLKSLHHVPLSSMPLALSEISRVLKPGGVAYISEPVFDGDYNEIIRLFHDEELARKTAFESIVKSCKNNELESISQIFYLSLVRLKSFEDFVDKVINNTHTQHEISASLTTQIKHKFESYHKNSSLCDYEFKVPNRVNLLRKPKKEM